MINENQIFIKETNDKKSLRCIILLINLLDSSNMIFSSCFSAIN